MAISRAQLLKELLPGLNALFGMEYARYGEEHKEIYETEKSERSFEEETKLAGFSAAPVKNEGSAIAYDNAQEAFTARYTHETIALGFSITEEAMEDNLYDSLSARYTKALARGMAYTKQVKAAAILNNGFNSSVTYGDGVSLFSTAHPIDNGTVANTFSVQADLNETSLQDAIVGVQRFRDAAGLRIMTKPTKLRAISRSVRWCSTDVPLVKTSLTKRPLTARWKSMAYVPPFLSISTLMRSERAFTTLAPTPCRPPDTL